MRRTVLGGLAIAFAFVTAAAFAQSTPDLKGRAGEFEGRVINMYKHDPIFEIRVTRLTKAKTFGEKVEKLFASDPDLGSVVYIELPTTAKVYDEEGKPIEWKNLPKDRVVRVSHDGYLEGRPAPAELREAGIQTITVFWARQLTLQPKEAGTSGEEKKEMPDEEKKREAEKRHEESKTVPPH